MSERLAKRIRGRRASERTLKLKLKREVARYLQVVRDNERALIEYEILKACLECDGATLQ